MTNARGTESDLEKIKTVLNTLSNTKEINLKKMAEELGIDYTLLINIKQQATKRKKAIPVAKPITLVITDEYSEEMKKLAEIGIKSQVVKIPTEEDIQKAEDLEEEEERVILDIKEKLFIKRTLLDTFFENIEKEAGLVPLFGDDEFKFIANTVDRENPEVQKNIDEGRIIGISISDVANARSISGEKIGREQLKDIILFDQLLSTGATPEVAAKKIGKDKYHRFLLEKLMKQKNRYLMELKQSYSMQKKWDKIMEKETAPKIEEEIKLSPEITNLTREQFGHLAKIYAKVRERKEELGNQFYPVAGKKIREEIKKFRKTPSKKVVSAVKKSVEELIAEKKKDQLMNKSPT